jgi:hypothetical protein
MTAIKMMAAADSISAALEKLRLLGLLLATAQMMQTTSPTPGIDSNIKLPSQFQALMTP